MAKMEGKSDSSHFLCFSHCYNFYQIVCEGFIIVDLTLIFYTKLYMQVYYKHIGG